MRGRLVTANQMALKCSLQAMRKAVFSMDIFERRKALADASFFFAFQASLNQMM
jgi:hypothetical protein